MICKVYGYEMNVEDTSTDENAENITITSQGSRADYACWANLVIRGNSHSGVDVPVVIVETKHLNTISNKCIAQVIGYYIKARGDKSQNRHGIALLINEYDGIINVEFFLFPFVVHTDLHEVTYGVQSLKLMSYECDFQE